jgi:hypothetical protein
MTRTTVIPITPNRIAAEAGFSHAGGCVFMRGIVSAHVI